MQTTEKTAERPGMCTNTATKLSGNMGAIYDGQTAAVGRVVHYVAWGVPGKFPSICRAATITEVDEQGNVGLAVTNPTGVFFHPIAHENGPCKYSDVGPGAEPVRGTWHWPARV